MPDWRIVFTKSAEQDLGKLDVSIRRRVIAKLSWLEKNFEKGPLARRNLDKLIIVFCLGICYYRHMKRKRPSARTHLDKLLIPQIPHFAGGVDFRSFISLLASLVFLGYHESHEYLHLSYNH